ncbi:MlaD family protein [Akkermansiaceae bacterium]|nr:MlaD family protein [Akkermansiaceae bacterium]
METKLPEEKPTPAKPKVSKNRNISAVWIIPILGLILGVWLVVKYYNDQGPLIEVRFNHIDGIVTEKTKVRCSSVVIGKVEKISLGGNFDVVLSIRLEKEYSKSIREGTRFWIVRPRISGSTITGLSTIVSGSYIAFDPGPSDGPLLDSFVGLEDPPVTPSSVPGLRLNLTTNNPGIIDVGSPLYYQGTTIGSIESRRFDGDTRLTHLGVFVEEKFSNLVNSQTRFWRDNGIELEIGADGFELDLPSLASLISGSVRLESPPNTEFNTGIESGTSFIMYNEKAQADASTFDFAEEFLVLANQSVRGLSKSAPVEYRGLRIGRVKEISYELIEGTSTNKIPILIELDKTLLAKHFPLGNKDEEAGYLVNATKSGLRATLKSSSLITGQLVVDLAYYKDLDPEPIVELAGHKLLPSVESGLARMEDKLAAVLAKINGLPIEDLLAEFNKATKEGTATISRVRTMLEDDDGVVAETQRTMKEAKETLAALKKIIDSDAVHQIPTDVRASLASLQKILDNEDITKIPHDLRNTLGDVKSALKPFTADGDVHGDLLRTLDEIRATVRSLERTSSAIGDKPNSLLFGKDKSSKEAPKAKP